MPGVLVVFVAHELLQFDIRCKRGVEHSCPLLLKRARIVERDLDLEMTEIGTPQPLDDVKLVAVGLAAETEPAAIAKSDRVDDERIAVPSTNLVAEPIRTHS